MAKCIHPSQSCPLLSLLHLYNIIPSFKSKDFKTCIALHGAFVLFLQYFNTALQFRLLLDNRYTYIPLPDYLRIEFENVYIYLPSQ